MSQTWHLIGTISEFNLTIVRLDQHPIINNNQYVSLYINHFQQSQGDLNSQNGENYVKYKTIIHKQSFPIGSHILDYRAKTIEFTK